MIRPGDRIVDPEAAVRHVVDAAADSPLLAITGRAASGKTETLARRYAALLERDPALAIRASIVTAATAPAAAALAARIEPLLPGPRRTEWLRDGRYIGRTLDRLAFDILAEHTTLSGLAYDLEAIGAYDAEEIFARAIAPLFSADYGEFLGPDIDPEIPGLRLPERFAVAVLRLIRKLRDAQITPDAFLADALRGATAFYANPPNLAAPSLLLATQDQHRAALAVSADERERQRRRELDLAKLIAKLYRAYLRELVAHGCLTPADAIAEALRLLAEHPALARSYRGRFRIAFVDDVHDASTGMFALLQAIFGKTAAGVTVAGDRDAATQTFAGARPDKIFGAAATIVTLEANYCVPAQIAAIVHAVLEPHAAPPIPAGDEVRLYRAQTPQTEATFVAASIAARLAHGTKPEAIAVVHRSLRALALFEDALVDREIPIALHGDGALFARHDTLDALALMWVTVDPFMHAWLLRVLQMPLLGLSDASVALLCGEAANPQAPLFDLPAPDGGGRRWDRQRDLRLGTNVVRGDRDAELETEGRARLAAFRARRTRWQDYTSAAAVSDAAAAIVGDGGLFERRPGETRARLERRIHVVEALLDVIRRYTERFPGCDLADALDYCARIARSESGPILGDEAGRGVVVGSIDRIKARRFEHVYVVDVRAGSFPPYYVPDAFLFSPKYGMIPKDSVGESVTARTAKFTWYAHHAQLRENYSREDRRALAVALGRANVSVTLSVSGAATRGVGASEFFAELETLVPALAIDAVPVAGSPPVAAVPELPSPRSQPEPHALGVVLAADRLAEMLRCLRCAPRAAVGAALDASFSLLSGRRPAGDSRVVERDIVFAFPLGAVSVFGTVPALVRHCGSNHVAVAGGTAAAALAIHALGSRVARDVYFVETADGVFDGPHPVAVATLVAQAYTVVDGTYRPLCTEHEER